MYIKQTSIRGRWCWYFVTLLLLMIGEAIHQNEASVMFPDDWEEIKLKLDSQMQEPSSNDSDSSDTEGIAPVVPLEEPDMSEDDAENILDEIGVNSTNDDTDDIELRFFNGANTRILRYQQQYGLEQTGELDRATKISLRSPKCGLSNVAAHGEDLKWSTPSLTYYVRNTPSGIPSDTVKQILRNAFNQWSMVTNLEFVDSNDPAADIEIVFGGRSHDNRKGKCKNVLGDTSFAHAYYPQGGAIHFNTKFFPGSMSQDEFFTTAMHEIGHAIGLEHSVSQASLMFPIPVARFSAVPEPDVERIQLKYGKRQRLESTEIPTFCEVPKYDAVLYHQNKLVIIAGKYCYTKLKPGAEPTLLSEMWPGGPDTLDAAETFGLLTYLFKGDQVWAFKDARLQTGYPRKIHVAFPGLPRNLGDVVYDKQKYLYAFKKDHYWRYNTVNKDVDRSDEIEDYGVPGMIDAACFDSNKKRLFFFKDSMYPIKCM
ncbi:collagenase 3 [Aedes albopictus]|uniref:Peptidase metallopeptidase domain-containing protein n=1 Tax=Aedes albopictus TaxID=7160 RepID=A0ABM1YHW7_AEDAL